MFTKQFKVTIAALFLIAFFGIVATLVLLEKRVSLIEAQNVPVIQTIVTPSPAISVTEEPSVSPTKVPVKTGTSSAQ